MGEIDNRTSNTTKIWTIATSPVALLVIAAIIIVLRSPDLIFVGRFWAEEAAIYFRDAFVGSFYEVILAPRIGYYSFFNKVASLAATTVPLEAAPLVTTYFAFAAQLFVIWLVLKSDAFAKPILRVIALLIALFCIYSLEVWLNSINTQFHLALGTAILLVTSATVIPAAVRLGYLTVAGLTGPVSVFLAPFFFWRAFKERHRQQILEAAIIGTAAVLQALIVLNALMDKEREGSFDLNALLSGLLIKLVANPFLGDITFRISPILLSGDFWPQAFCVIILTTLAGAMAAALAKDPTARLLALSALALAVLSSAGAIGNQPWGLARPLFGMRYYFAPTVLLGLALAIVLFSERAEYWRRAIALVLIFNYLANGLDGYARQDGLFGILYRGPSWQAEVAAWRADPNRTTLRVWPQGWVVDLPNPNAIQPSSRTPAAP